MEPALLALWVALAVCVLAAAVTGVSLVRRALRFWGVLKRVSATLGAGAEALAALAEDASRRVEGAGTAAERLTAATERLSRSLAYARVVADAGGDVAAALLRIRKSVPRR